MIKRIFYSALAALAILPASIWCSDVPGNWMAYEPLKQEFTGRLLPIGETVFCFKVDGAKLTGTISGANGQTLVIREGKIDRDVISFTVERNLSGKIVRHLYRGVVLGDEIRFTRKTQDETGKCEFAAWREFPRDGDIPLIRRRLPDSLQR